ncbi:molybdenum cofactor guanylyltransferase MobA [Lutibaculum baratangense]|uniref:Molybdenum cofactor guanylyltransferase n=1 Tax=Lutibaculum baratangense AMV1 TaxID=631454 RepID=V4RN79_9HYPH|nr:molybdenum cofactor guanylyltransferase MobA [Lutibaculum baratangense]ESR26744.1 Molybdopterin-guanine dinucleotide biosynthesis protein MobA [Lutibaculum baratangense AMV1]
MERAETSNERAAVTGCILAGGLSRRMGGGDKSLRTLAGKAMLQHVIDRLKPQVGAIVLNANGDASRFAGFGLPVQADLVEGHAGPLAGVLAGLRWAAENTPEATFVATAATDTPFFPQNLVSRMIEATEGRRRIVLGHSGERVHPVFGLWPVALADDLEAAVREEGLRKVLVWVHRHDNAVVDFPVRKVGEFELDPFFNANTPEDMAIAEKLISEAA